MMAADLAHPAVAFWLDVADKVIKFLAVLVGAAWTWLHYRRSRTYAQKLELQLTGALFRREDALYLEIGAGLKNIGATVHRIQEEGTTCEILAIRDDLLEEPLRLLPVFEGKKLLEPGVFLHDLIYYRVDLPALQVIWIRVNLRVVSGELESNQSCLIRTG